MLLAELSSIHLDTATVHAEANAWLYKTTIAVFCLGLVMAVSMARGMVDPSYMLQHIVKTHGIEAQANRSGMTAVFEHDPIGKAELCALPCIGIMQAQQHSLLGQKPPTETTVWLPHGGNVSEPSDSLLNPASKPEAR
jgi:hypothetical protein